jgi:hypothetical protein
MQRRTWALAVWVCAGAVLAAGCGKPTLPGKQFQGQRLTLPGLVATDTPLPAKPIQEWGPKDAKVRVLVLFPIDDAHKKLMDLVKGLAEKYPGKVHVKYADYRTPEGAQVFRQAKATIACVMINGATSADLQSKYGAQTIDFVKEMGRYWTEDDLRAAVANAVAKAYGKQK